MERTEEGTPLSIREHAAEWFLRLHAHDLNVAERFAYLQWLKSSPVHIGETLQMCILYSILYPMKKQIFFTNEDDVSNVIELATREDSRARRLERAAAGTCARSPLQSQSGSCSSPERLRRAAWLDIDDRDAGERVAQPDAQRWQFRQRRAAHGTARSLRSGATAAEPVARRSAVPGREGSGATVHRRGRARRGPRDGHEIRRVASVKRDVMSPWKRARCWSATVLADRALSPSQRRSS